MRLLYVTANMPFGFPEIFFIPEMAEIVRQGHDMLIVPRSPPSTVVHRDADGLVRLAVRERLLSLRVLGGAIREFLRAPIDTLKLFATTLLHSGSVVNACQNLAVFPKGLWMARLARSWKAEHIHAQWAASTATMAMVASAMSGIPWSFTAHRRDIVQNNLLAQKRDSARFTRFISRDGVKLAESMGTAGWEDKARIIHMGAICPPPEDALATSTNQTAVFCVANLIPVKGHRYLLEAMRLLKDRGVICSLTLVGNGELLQELQAMATALAIDDRTRFLGGTRHEEVLDFYRRGEAGLFVLPSVNLGNGLHEGIPVSLMEAMAWGIPVVSTITGGISELLHDGAGLLVPDKDPAALADALECILRDADLRRQIAKAGRCRIEEEFAMNKVVADLMKEIEACTKHQALDDRGSENHARSG